MIKINYIFEDGFYLDITTDNLYNYYKYYTINLDQYDYKDAKYTYSDKSKEIFIRYRKLSFSKKNIRRISKILNKLNKNNG